MSSRRWLARPAAVLAVVTVLGGLSGCTPADEPVTALRNVDGHPTLLIVSCSEVQIDRVSVFGEGSTQNGTFQSGPKWTVGDLRRQIGGEVRLLDPSTSLPVVEGDLTEFTPGAEYTVAAYGDPDTIPIRFTVEEVAALAPGQVLVAPRPGERKAVSQSTFEKKARESC